MEVTGADLGPCVGDADDGLVQVFLAEADAAEVGAGSGAGGAFGEDDGIFLWIDLVAQGTAFQEGLVGASANGCESGNSRARFQPKFRVVVLFKCVEFGFVAQG